MATNSSAIFTGTSQYSNDFQNIINRAVAIASLPIQQMNNTVGTLTAQQSALQALNGQLSSLGNAVSAIDQANSSTGYQAVASTADVQATLGAGASLGSYTVQVDSLGAYTSAMSANGLPVVTDPATSSISASSQYTLSINGANYTLNPSADTLSALAQSINAAGAPVTATVVNVGSSSSPDYRLSVQGTNLNNDQIQVNDGTNNLLATQVPGAPATYQVNGSSTVISSNSRSITLSPGLTVQLNAVTGADGPTTVTVERNASSLQNALNSFVNAYNTVAGTLNQQHGQKAGPLSGDSILMNVNSALRQFMSTMGASGSVQSAADMGLTLNQDGTLSLDPSVLATANPNDVAAFLGSVSGGGFLQAANNALSGLDDPTNGSVTQELGSVQDQIDYQNQQISDTQDRVNQMQQSLQAQMSKADALIAQMEQQVSYLSGMFQAMQYNQRMISGG